MLNNYYFLDLCIHFLYTVADNQISLSHSNGYFKYIASYSLKIDKIIACIIRANISSSPFLFRNVQQEGKTMRK